MAAACVVSVLTAAALGAAPLRLRGGAHPRDNNLELPQRRLRGGGSSHPLDSPSALPRLRQLQETLSGAESSSLRHLDPAELASLASERCCDEDPRSPDAALDDAYRRYVAARDAPPRTPTPEPTTFDASTTPPPGLRVHARRPAQAATPLDVFLRLRGLDAHADVLYGLGARKIGDLRYLRKEDYAGVGLDLGDLDMKVQF